MAQWSSTRIDHPTAGRSAAPAQPRRNDSAELTEAEYAENAGRERGGLRSGLGTHQLLVRHPMRRVRLRTLPSPEVRVVLLEVPLEPHHLAVPLEREDVRRDPVEEPAIV